MRIQTRSSSKHLTFAAHTPHAISAESVVRSTQISARARIASRSGVGVGVGTASTTAKRFLNDKTRGRSQAKDLEGHQARRQWIGCRPSCNPGTRSRSRVCSDSHAVFTVARRSLCCVPLSRWRPTRGNGASVSVSPDLFCRSKRRGSAVGFRETP